MSLNPYQPSIIKTQDVAQPGSAEAALGGDIGVRHSLECVQFVRRALSLAQSDRELSPTGIANAAAVCRVALELACDLYGVAGKQKLIDWGIVTSQDVGTIVYRLIDAQLAVRADSDSIDDFVGLFDLTRPPEAWKLQW